MRKVPIALFLFTAAILFQFCSSSKKATTSAPVITFEGNVKPVIEASCAPCHIAGKGKIKALDNFANASAEADEIIKRIQKNPGEHGFMPMRNAKLADSSIALFVDWKQSGLKEK